MGLKTCTLDSDANIDIGYTCKDGYIKVTLSDVTKGAGCLSCANVDTTTKLNNAPTGYLSCTMSSTIVTTTTANAIDGTVPSIATATCISGDASSSTQVQGFANTGANTCGSCATVAEATSGDTWDSSYTKIVTCRTDSSNYKLVPSTYKCARGYVEFYPKFGCMSCIGTDASANKAMNDAAILQYPSCLQPSAATTKSTGGAYSTL